MCPGWSSGTVPSGISGAAELTETSIAKVKPYVDLIVYGRKIGETTLLDQISKWERIVSHSGEYAGECDSGRVGQAVPR